MTTRPDHRRAMIDRATILRRAQDAARQGDASGAAILRHDARTILRAIRGTTR